MRLESLYTVPKTFEPIRFTSGFNVILGERDESSSKNNGVGKSLCIEFINFALLKKRSESRVIRIPSDVLHPKTMICVDFFIGTTKYTIRRSVEASDKPELESGGKTTRFDRLEHAADHMSSLLFQDLSGDHPSFREILGPLIRDERSEFKTLAGCYDTALKLPDNYTPHLFLLGIDTSIYEDLRRNSRESSEKTTERSGILRSLKLLRKNGTIAEARAELNGLQKEVEAIGDQLSTLENTKGFEVVKDDIISLEAQIDDARRRRGIVLASIQRLKPIAQPVNLDTDDVKGFYDQLKNGLGTMVSRDLTQVLGFKAEIERFQNKVLSERVATLKAEKKDLTDRIAAADKKLQRLISVLDQDGVLRSLRQTYAAHREKSDAAGQLKAFITEHDRLSVALQKLKSKREELVTRMLGSIVEAQTIISSLEDTILTIHDFIQGNKRASFNVEASSSARVIDLNMRIDSDGSHSIEREKVFIYDYALLTNTETKVRHPGFLVHDNVFEVDQDTLRKSIEFLIADAELEGQQYLLTLNADRLEQDEELAAIIEPHVRARFTKTDRFLGRGYQEVR